MASLPTGKPGQALAIGLLVLFLVVAWLGIAAPLLDFYGSRAEELSSLRARSAREAALIAALPSLKAQAQAAAHAPARAVLAGNSDAIAGATLQEQVQSMASDAHAQVTSIETLPAEQVGAYRRIGVHIEMSAQLAVVVALLRAIEDAQPTMLVDDIRLTATPVAPQNNQLPLDAAFTVFAFRAGTSRDAPP